MNEIEKIGIVAMPRISVGGGFARVTRDLIATLNSMNKKVYLLTPFNVDIKKINRFYGPIKIDKIYYPNRFKTFFCREDALGRRLLKKEFQKMAKEVDFIIDMDGSVLHNYLPKNFDNSNYIIWRVSCINPDTHKIQKFTSSKILLRKFIRRIIFSKKCVPEGVKVFPLDSWTKKEIIDYWKIKPRDKCLYPEIKVEEFSARGKKENKIIVFGRISPNKSIDEAIRIFYQGKKSHPEYELIILGGATPDSKKYMENLNTLTDNLGISDKVKVIPNPSFEQIKKVLSKSKVLIDAQKGVSLTMTSIEAMAAGCIVLAQKNGGTYIEVLDNGKFGYGFKSVEEGSERLDNILSRLNKKIFKGFNSKKSVQRAAFFSAKNFEKRLGEVLNER